MSLHPHQHAHLVAELRKLTGRPVEEVRALFHDADLAQRGKLRVPKPMLAVSFLPQEKFDRVSPKRRANRVAVSDDYAKQHPSGVPGMPNTILPEDFAAAWREANS